jgi:hypothetical protein
VRLLAAGFWLMPAVSCLKIGNLREAIAVSPEWAPSATTGHGGLEERPNIDQATSMDRLSFRIPYAAHMIC